MLINTFTANGNGIYSILSSNCPGHLMRSHVQERKAQEREQRRQDELKAKAANEEKERLAEQLKEDLQKMEDDRLNNKKKDNRELDESKT